MNSFDEKQNCVHMKKHGGMFYLEINVGVICFFLGDARENIQDRNIQCVIQSAMMLFESHPSQEE